MQKNALPLGRAFGLLQPYCQGPISTLDSVVYNDSTFGQEKQENDKSARIPTLFNFFSSRERNA